MYYECQLHRWDLRRIIRIAYYILSLVLILSALNLIIKNAPKEILSAFTLLLGYNCILLWLLNEDRKPLIKLYIPIFVFMLNVTCYFYVMYYFSGFLMSCIIAPVLIFMVYSFASIISERPYTVNKRYCAKIFGAVLFVLWVTSIIYGICTESF